MNTSTFMFAVLVVSTLTGLMTSAVKRALSDFNVTPKPNLLAGVCSFILSAASSVGYAIYTGIEINAQYIVLCVALVFVSWLCAMLGYDKVAQTLGQLTKSEVDIEPEEEEEE